MQYKRWPIPFTLTAMALGCFAVGMGWAVLTGIAVPDPEATPVMKANEQTHHRIVAVMFGVGALMFVASVLISLILLMKRRRHTT